MRAVTPTNQTHMKPNIPLKNLLLSAAAALGLAASAQAGGLPDATAMPGDTTPVRQGLLGQNYATLTYSYLALSGPTHADNFEFAFNQPLRAGLDAMVAYDWSQTGLFAGTRLNTQSLTAGLRAFSNSFAWGKPYAEADAGYAWQRGAPAGTDNSVLWGAAAGVELAVAQATTVTPYVKYADGPDLAGKGTWNFGVNANYWIDSSWSVTAGVARDNHQTNVFTAGTNFRY